MTLLKKENYFVCLVQCNVFIQFKVKKHIIFHILYIIVAPIWPAFLKHVHFHKAHCSEKRGMLLLASYLVHCDWLNTSRVWRKCYAPYHIVMPCPGTTTQKL